MQGLSGAGPMDGGIADPGARQRHDDQDPLRQPERVAEPDGVAEPHEGQGEGDVHRVEPEADDAAEEQHLVAHRLLPARPRRSRPRARTSFCGETPGARVMSKSPP